MVLAVVLLASATACQTLPVQDRAHRFDEVAALVERHYFDASLGAQNWPALKAEHRARAVEARSAAGVDAATRDLLGRLQVSHLRLLAPRAAQPLQASVQRAAPADASSQIVPRTASEAPLQAPSHAPFQTLELARFTLASAEAFCEELRASPPDAPLLIDLRGNRGGQIATLRPLLGLFIDTPQVVGALRERSGTQPLRVWPQPHVHRGPLTVLIDARTASTAEAFAHALQRSGRGRVIGARSAGQVLVSRLFPLSSGQWLQVPVMDVLDVDAVSLEGRGVTPDVALDPDDDAAVRDLMGAHAGPSWPRAHAASEAAVAAPVSPLPPEAEAMLERLGASLMPQPAAATRLLLGRVTRTQGDTQMDGTFWLAQEADGTWTFGERIESGALAGVEARHGRDAQGDWMQHSTTGFQRRLPQESTLWPLWPPMPRHAAREVRAFFAPQLEYAGVIAQDAASVGVLFETVNAQRREIRIDVKTGALLQRGATRYHDVVEHRGARLPMRVETEEAVRDPASGNMHTLRSVYRVEQVRYDEGVPETRHGPAQNCFTRP